VYGISNGVNRSVINRYLASLTNTTEDDLECLTTLLKAKQATMCRLQKEFGLQANENARMVSFVGRLAEQKGLSLLSGLVEHAGHSTLEDLLIRHKDLQIIVAGPTTEGEQNSTNLRQALAYLVSKYPGRIATRLDYVPHSKALEIIFGSSLFLMPSRFEPGGITQLEALAAGTLVIGRNVGGISATIHNYERDTETGTGFLFNDYTPTALANTAHWALETVRDPSTYAMLVQNARAAEHDWSDRVGAYRAMLQRIILGNERFESLPWNGELKARLRSIHAQ
jgi:starch synthase